MKQKDLRWVLLALVACGIMEATSIYSVCRHNAHPETWNAVIEVVTYFMCVAPVALGTWIYYLLVWKHRNVTVK